MRRFLLAAGLFLAACANQNDLVLADAALDDAATTAARDEALGHADDLRAAVTDLCAAAPAPTATGWSAATHPDAVARMRDSWRRARVAYQSIEGLMDMFLGDVDAAVDARLEAALAAGPDENPFDDEGFVGMHAVERILWADQIPAAVAAAEASAGGIAAASFPQTAEQATDFRDELCARLVTDAATLRERLGDLTLDAPSLYEAGVRLVEAQAEKLAEAAEGHDECRYAGATLADMRANLASAKRTHALFAAWLATKAEGPHVAGEVDDGFAALEAAYAAVEGDALPPVPVGWDAERPAPASLATPYGTLFSAASAASDDTVDGSLAHSLDEAAGLLGIRD
jgi:iron uptake system component EfeO